MKILAFAYACEPDRGSEPGAGWVGARLLARLGETWVITRANNREPIEQGLIGLAEREQLHFVYVDLPNWLLWWKQGQRGVRLYYLLWQLAAWQTARTLHRRHRFDLSWHLTFANAWLGSVAPLLRPPCVYGPVGAGVGTAWTLLPTLGVRGAFRDVGHALARTGGRYLNPLARLAWCRATLILTQNPDTRAWLPARQLRKAHVFGNVVLSESSEDSDRRPGGQPTALFAGRLLPHKGVALAIRALTELPGWRLIICGSGPDRGRLERVAARLRVRDQVSFLGHLPRDRVLALMGEADVFVFPSLHDEAGWVVAEARSRGLPVVCLDRGGPPCLGGVGVRAGWPKTTARALARAMERVVAAPRPEPATEFAFEHRSRELAALLQEAGLVPLAAVSSPAQRAPQR